MPGRLEKRTLQIETTRSTLGVAMEVNLPLVAGAISTVIFALSALPMLWKAFPTRDLRSYSLGNIVLSNVGNVFHSIYIYHLPAGPIWLLHAFYLVTTGMMLVCYLRYEGRASSARRRELIWQP